MLDHACRELFTARRIVKELERSRVTSDAPQHAEMIGNRLTRGIRHEPEIDPARVCWDLRVGLDGTAGLERGADHLLAELIEPGAHRRRDHGMQLREYKETGHKPVSYTHLTLPTSD